MHIPTIANLVIPVSPSTPSHPPTLPLVASPSSAAHSALSTTLVSADCCQVPAATAQWSGPPEGYQWDPRGQFQSPFLLFNHCGTLPCCPLWKCSHLLGSPWNGSFRCPSISLTILSLLPLPTLVTLRFPPKPYLPFLHYLQNILSILMVLISPGKILKFPSLIPRFMNSDDKLLTRGSFGVYPLASLLALHKRHPLAVYLCSGQLWDYYFLTQKPSMASSVTLLPVVFRTSEVQL